jgi:O-antigen ligase
VPLNGKQAVFTPAQNLYPDTAQANPIRILGFNFALALVFLRFSMLHEMIAVATGINSHLVMFLGLPVALLMILSGGLGRTLRGRPARYWLAFVGWMVLAIPFSSWRGGSFATVTDYVRVNFLIMFVVAGLVTTWKDCKKLIYTIALAASVNVATAKLFQADNQARLTLETGSIGNANDYVAHVLFLLPFVLFVLLMPKRSFLVRFACSVTICYGLYLASTAASRGGLVAFVVMCLFILTRASPALRFGVCLAVPLLMIVFVSLLPTSTRDRYATLFTNESQDQGALDSTRARTYLLKTSIQFTLENPIFGVGPGEFLDTEGSTARKRGELGSWHAPHNSYTQVSSEAGIPALIFFIASLVSTYLVLQKVYRAADGTDAEKQQIARAAFFLQLALVGFSCAIIFLSLVYTIYLPFLTGFAIALQNVVRTGVSAPTSTVSGLVSA